MKIIACSLLALMLSLSLAIPAEAQNPAVHMTNGPNNWSVNFTLKNLGPGNITIGIAELRIYDKSTCKLLCAVKNKIGKSLGPCKTLDWKIGCNMPVQAEGYIYYLRIRNTAGISLTEDWMFSS